MWVINDNICEIDGKDLTKDEKLLLMVKTYLKFYMRPNEKFEIGCCYGNGGLWSICKKDDKLNIFGAFFFSWYEKEIDLDCIDRAELYLNEEGFGIQLILKPRVLEDSNIVYSLYLYPSLVKDIFKKFIEIRRGVSIDHKIIESYYKFIETLFEYKMYIDLERN